LGFRRGRGEGGGERGGCVLGLVRGNRREL